MKEYLKKNGVRIAVLAAAVVLMIALSIAARSGRLGLADNAAGALAAPVQKIVGAAAHGFETIYNRLYDYDNIRAENESLRAQLAEAQQSARDGVEAAEENARLQQLLELHSKHPDYVFESAKVVLWSSDNWAHSFTISKGTSSGIELGDPVITEYNAVVGQVTEVDENWATVSTIIDVDMSLGAFAGDAGSSGIVLGEYALMRQRLAKLTYLVDGAQIYVGDEVLTSGAGGAFPEGLLVGRISAVQTEAGGQVLYGLVEPECAFESLVQVFVIKDFEALQ